MFFFSWKKIATFRQGFIHIISKLSINNEIPVCFFQNVQKDEPPPPPIPQVNHISFMACITLGSFEENGLYFQFVTQRECCIEIHYFFFPLLFSFKTSQLCRKKRKKKRQKERKCHWKSLKWDESHLEKDWSLDVCTMGKPASPSFRKTLNPVMLRTSIPLHIALHCNPN